MLLSSSEVYTFHNNLKAIGLLVFVVALHCQNARIKISFNLDFVDALKVSDACSRFCEIYRTYLALVPKLQILKKFMFKSFLEKFSFQSYVRYLSLLISILNLSVKYIYTLHYILSLMQFPIGWSRLVVVIAGIKYRKSLVRQLHQHKSFN